MLFIDSAVPMVLQWPTLGALEATISRNFCRSMRPAASSWRAYQTMVPEPARPPAKWPSSIGPARQHDGRDVDRRRAHDHGGRGLVAAGGQHDAVEEVAVEALDQAEIGEVAIERRGRPLARLLDRMDGKLDGNAAGVADAVAHAHRQVEVMAVAGRQIAAGLGDADDRPAAVQLGERQAEIHVPFEVERRHGRIARSVEPFAAAQPALAVALPVGALLLAIVVPPDFVGAT